MYFHYESDSICQCLYLLIMKICCKVTYIMQNTFLWLRW